MKYVMTGLAAGAVGFLAGRFGREAASCLAEMGRRVAGAGWLSVRGDAALPSAENAQQAAFETMMRYDADTAYGMKEGEG